MMDRMSRSVGEPRNRPRWSSGLESLQIACALLAIVTGLAVSLPAKATTGDAIRSLLSEQDAYSGWGAGRDRARSTATALEALALVSEDLPSVVRGRLALSGISAPTIDAEARRVLAGIGDEATLIALRNPFDPATGRPNASEGGWGLAPGYASDVLDTALALRALAFVGVPLGIDIVDATVAAGAFDQHGGQLVPSTATTIQVLVNGLDAAGAIQVRVGAGSPPTLADPFFSLSGPITNPINLTGIPFAPGAAYFIRVDGVASSSTYSVELAFSAPGVDTGAVSEALAYLRASQNFDGGFGLQPTDDSLVSATSESILASLALPNQAVPDLAAAVAFLEGRQAGDGSFGSVGETSAAYLALVQYDPTSLAALAAYNYLVAAQQVDGSWPGGPDQTALALNALLKPPSSIDGDRDGLTDAFEIANGFNPSLTDSDGNGILDGDEDSDVDGVSAFAEQSFGSNAQLADGDGDGDDDGIELANGEDPVAGFVDVQIPEGFSLFAHPTAVSPGLSAYGLLSALGVGGPGEEIARLDPLTGLYETAGFSGGVPIGVDFPIATNEGYVLKLDTQGQFRFEGAPDSPLIDLASGLNLIGLPSVPGGLTAFTLLQAIGDDSVVQSIVSFEPDNAVFESATYEGGVPTGVNFPIEIGRGYYVTMNQGLSGFTPPVGPSITIDSPANGGSVSTANTDVTGTIDPSVVAVDVNGISASLSPGQYTATAVPLVLGANSLTATATDNLGLTGMATAQVNLNFSPQITIDSPLDGTIVSSEPVLVSGTIVDDEPVTVTVNGVPATLVGSAFSASVPLPIQGTNLITAIATDPFGEMGTDSISVTLNSVDYSIPINGSVSDTRLFTASSALLDQIAFFTESQIGVPTGVTYTTTGVSRISATEMQVGFSIAVDPAASVGSQSFQVEYGLLDAGSNPLVPLIGNVFSFAIEVTP